jgi:hypothetical protein
VRTVSDSCLIFGPLSYAVVPRKEREAALEEGRAVRDDGNLADSAETQEAIGQFNRTLRGLCPAKK